MNFNPSAPTTLGPEWPPAAGAYSVIPSAVAMELVSTATETIDNVQVPIEVQGSVDKRWVLDIYDRDAMVGSATYSRAYAYPNGESGVTGVVDETGGTTTIYTSVDENPIDEADYAVWAVQNHRIDWEFNTAALTLTGKRITSVKVWVAGHEDNDINTSYWVAIRAAGVSYGTKVVTHRRAERSVDWGEINPVTGQPWTPSDIANFDSGTYLIRIQRKSSHRKTARIARVRMQITYQTEWRVARGAALISDDGLATFSLATPAGVDNWAKTTGETYLLVLRRANSTNGGQLRWPYIESDRALPSGAQAYPKAVITSDGIVQPLAGALSAPGSFRSPDLGSPANRAYPMILRTTAPANSTDSQPYEGVIFGQIDVNEPAANDEQEFTPAASNTYILLTLAISVLDDRDLPTDSLTVVIRRRSDNVQVGGSLVITADDFLDAERIGVQSSTSSPRLIKGNLSSGAALVSGTQYYLDFTSAGSTALNPWLVWGYEAGSGLSQGAQGYGGTTDRAKLAGTESDDYDLFFMLATQPTAPASLTVHSATQLLDIQYDTETGEASSCAIERIEAIGLIWAATSLAGSFARYEIQRSDATDATWQTIAEIDSEATVSFVDYESRYGIATSYRIRVVRTDEAVSAWTDGDTAVTIQLDCGGLTLTSNQDPTQNLAYFDLYTGMRADRTYEFLDAAAVEFQHIMGRDGAVAFWPTETRGEAFTRTLKLNSEALPATSERGEALFGPLRAFARDESLPYVCVRDHEGGRWFANVRVPQGRVSQPGNHYYATVEVTELVTEPFAVTPE